MYQLNSYLIYDANISHIWEISKQKWENISQIFSMELRERIMLIRKNFNLGVVEFSNRIGISKSSLDRYEKGQSETPSSVIANIIEVFNVDSDWLLFGKGGDKVIFKGNYVEKDELIQAQSKIASLQEQLIQYQMKEIEQLQKQNSREVPVPKPQD